MTEIVSDEQFRAEQQLLWNEDMKLKDASNLFQGLEDLKQETSVLHLWYDSPSGELYVRIHDVPGTLSGDILRLKANLPPLTNHSMIEGDDTLSIPFQNRPLYDPKEEDATDIVSQLPVVAYNDQIHFAKRCRCRAEVPNLLRAKGCPNVVKLLGRTEDGLLVFHKYCSGRALSFASNNSIISLKRILIQLAEAVISLHLLGIIHHDLHIDNVLGSPDYLTAYLCDLECYWGSDECPEISGTLSRPLSETPYSEKSDVYMFGRLMTDFIMGNGPRTRWQAIVGGNWLPPAPFHSIALACVRQKASERPGMQEVKDMLEAIPVPGDKTANC